MIKHILPLVALLVVQSVFAFEISIEKNDGTQVNFDSENIKNMYLGTTEPAKLCLAVTNGNVTWKPDSNENVKVIEFKVTLKDANNQPIPNAELFVSGSLGLQADEQYFIYTDNEGNAYHNWNFYREDCPHPSPGGPGVTTATLSVAAVGYPLSDSSMIILYRYVP